MTRLLYLGFAFPPGVAELHPDWSPAGQGMETQMVAALRGHFDLRSTGTFPFRVDGVVPTPQSTPGVAHELTLLDGPPQVWQRWRSLAQLKKAWRDWQRAGWKPSAVLVLNLSPIYNAFVRWLRRQSPRPRIILLLSDSEYLQSQPAWTKRFRRAFKPFVWADGVMAAQFDACIALSRATENFFATRKIPWSWMPGGCSPQRAFGGVPAPAEGPVRFGYFGAFAPHAGLSELMRVFTASDRPNQLHICGWGKSAPAVIQKCAQDSRLKYHGTFGQDECLRWAAANCDVLVNPRPAAHGNQNNFPSKIFEYALSGRAILTTRISGVDAVLGPDGFFLDENNFDASLAASLNEVARTPRAELNRRGAALRERVTAQFSWAQQAGRMAAFINGLG